MQNSRYQPHLNSHYIPAGAQAPVRPNASSRNYSFEVVPPPAYREPPVNPWDEVLSPSSVSPTTPTLRPRAQSSHTATAQRPHLSPVQASATTNGIFTFPEPQIYQPSTSRPMLFQQPPTGHRYSRSDLDASSASLRSPSVASLTSTTSSYGAYDDRYATSSSESYSYEKHELSDALSTLSLDSEESLRRFQAGELPENDQEWHRLVPPEALEALGKMEVQRQSVMFEIIKSEREYVADLEAVQQVFIEGLRRSSPPVIQESRLPAFIQEVFGNLTQILSHHQRITAALFARQREQHPLIQSIADIVLDTTLKSEFRQAYEVYIKHYPLSESHHRKELKRNREYGAFVQSVSTDSRIRRRDLITFLSRPVTRLPRLNLLFEQLLKLTDKEYEHPDVETLPIIVRIFSDCIKSTQPGIEAAESKVRFWALCETLIFQKGEIIDMDLYDESRTLIHSGPACRRTRSETGFSSWSDLVVALLDNYLLLTREEVRPNGSTARFITSRPIPLSFLRLGSFNDPPETRRERSEEGGILDSLRYQTVLVYPFTVYHAFGRYTRRYTLHVASDAMRRRWYNVLVDALGVHQVRQDGNMWFDPRTLTDGYFRGAPRDHVGARVTGKITSAVPFSSGGRKYIAVACSSGIYVSTWGTDNFRKVLSHQDPNSIAALQMIGSKVFNKFIVHAEPMLLSYPLDEVARVALGHGEPRSLEATMERIGGSDANIVLAKSLQMGRRFIILYASKRRLGSTLTLNVVEVIDTSEATLAPRRTVSTTPTRGYRPFGEPGFIPKDAYNVTPLNKMIGICTNDGIVIADPTNLATSAVTLVPNLRDAGSNLPMQTLKERIADSKPLGLVRVDASELLVIYDSMGCYITKHGMPNRSSGFIRWETKATSCAHCGGNVLLFSPEFIEVRNIMTGRIVQVIEGKDIRLLHPGGAGSGTDDPILVAMRGARDDRDGVSEKVCELSETSEIPPATPVGSLAGVWDEWDM